MIPNYKPNMVRHVERRLNEQLIVEEILYNLRFAQCLLIFQIIGHNYFHIFDIIFLDILLNLNAQLF